MPSSSFQARAEVAAACTATSKPAAPGLARASLGAGMPLLLLLLLLLPWALAGQEPPGR